MMTKFVGKLGRIEIKKTFKSPGGLPRPGKIVATPRLTVQCPPACLASEDIVDFEVPEFRSISMNLWKLELQSHQKFIAIDLQFEVSNEFNTTVEGLKYEGLWCYCKFTGCSTYNYEPSRRLNLLLWIFPIKNAICRVHLIVKAAQSINHGVVHLDDVRQHLYSSGRRCTV